MTRRIGRTGMTAALLAGSMLAVALVGQAGATEKAARDIEASGLAGRYLAARIADVAKDFGNAASLYRSAVEADPANLFLLERSVVLSAASGDVDQAVRAAKNLLDQAPSSHAARLILAVDHIKHGRYAQAAEALEQSGAGVLADLTSALLVAWARFGAGEVDQALEDLTALQGEEWYEPFKLLHGGYIALAAGRTEEAIRLLDQARELDENAVRITEAYARALAVAGRKEEAVEVLEEFLERFPDNALARAALTDVEAGRAAEGAVSTPVEGASEALAGIGAAVGQDGGVEIATLYLRLSMYLDPQIAGGLAALSLGTLLDATGQGEAALEAFEGIDPQAPFRGVGALRAALALDRLDRTKEAEQAFKEAIRRAPDDVQAYTLYGNMLRGRERYAEAAELYTQAIDRVGTPDQNDWTLFYFRGIANERSKRWDEAEADFKKALELYPDQPLVLNYLGYSWVDAGRNLEEGLDMIKKAVELRPRDGYIVDSLGWAYYQLGRYEDAVRELERAVELQPEDPVIHDHLGDAYWKIGRPLEAQFQWRHARDFGAKSPDLELILRKIAEGRLIEKQVSPALEKAEAGAN